MGQKQKKRQSFQLGRKEAKMDFHIIAPIQKELRRSLPFPEISSRLATATILQFYGNLAQVCQFMQILSHRS